MTPNEFQNLAKSVFNDYFGQVYTQQKQGNLASDVKDGTMLYPTHLMAGSVDGWLCLELIGAKPSFTELKLKKLKIYSLESWLGSTGPSGNAMFIFDGINNSMKNILFTGPFDNDAFESRFPGLLDQYPTKFMGAGDFGKAFEVGPNSNFFALENTLTVDALNASRARFRRFSYGLIIRRDTPHNEVKEYLEKNFQLQNGVKLNVIRTLGKGKEEKAYIASHFANIFLREKIHETTIGDFLYKHPEIIIKGLNVESFEYEKTFKWQVHVSADDIEINPDLMLKRADGYYDIYDFKLPLLEKIKLTKAGRSRRRFIDKVSEGIAQLAHYKEYFSYPENRAYVERDFGIKVNEPRLGLIIGNVENYNKQQSQEAQRGLNEITIIDYDTLMQAYIVSE